MADETTVVIREAATDKDFDFVARNFEATIAQWEEYTVSEASVASRREEIRVWAREPDTHVTVAALPDGTPVGFNTLAVFKDYAGRDFGKVIILFVLEDRRRQGIGRKLKDEGECWLVSRGVDKVMTEIDARNEAALELNRRAGFEINSHTMVKRL